MFILDAEKPPLFCWAWNRVYVKANGRVPCWCDTGEPHTIVHKQFDKVDFISGIVNSPEMCAFRGQTLYAKQHYISQCETCCCMIDNIRGKHFRFADGDKPDFQPAQKSTAARKILKRVHEQRGWPIGSIDRIAEIQLEPSFPCNLKCPGCLQGFHPNPMETEIGPYVFPLKWFHKMLESIILHNVQLNRIVYVGRGEPTLNRQFTAMLTHARDVMPDLIMSMDTNSNQPFKDEYLLLNWINCSIDGSDQQSYESYRRGGIFDKTIQFMQDAITRKKIINSNCQIHWKYILFDTNDSDECLNRAQQIAKDIGIDELNLIITHCGSFDGSINPSKRFKTIASISDYTKQNPIFQHIIGSRST